MIRRSIYNIFKKLKSYRDGCCGPSLVHREAREVRGVHHEEGEMGVVHREEGEMGVVHHGEGEMGGVLGHLEMMLNLIVTYKRRNINLFLNKS